MRIREYNKSVKEKRKKTRSENFMRQESLSRWLKVIFLGVGLCGLVICGYGAPSIGQYLMEMYPEYSRAYPVWMGFLLLTAAPCYGGLACGWRIAGEIGRDNTFSRKNAGLLKWVSILAGADAGFFFLGNVALLFAGWNHPSILLASLLVVFAGASIAVVSAGVSHLVYKAALMREEAELTI